MTDRQPPEGRTVRVPYPWHKQLAGTCPHGELYRWRPGIRWEDDGYSDRDAVADGVGAMFLTEVGRYTPPGFGTRVFFTRQFALPSGELVGRPKLRVMGAGGFTRLCRGYRYDYEVGDWLADVKMDECPECEAELTAAVASVDTQDLEGVF